MPDESDYRAGGYPGGMMSAGYGVQMWEAALREAESAPGETLGPELSTPAGGGAWAGGGWIEAPPSLQATLGGVRTITNVSGTEPDPDATYRVTYEVVSIPSGNVQPRIGGGDGEIRVTPGVYTEDILALDGTKPQFRASAAPGVIVENWSFRKIPTT